MPQIYRKENDFGHHLGLYMYYTFMPGDADGETRAERQVLVQCLFLQGSLRAMRLPRKECGVDNPPSRISEFRQHARLHKLADDLSPTPCAGPFTELKTRLAKWLSCAHRMKARPLVSVPQRAGRLRIQNRECSLIQSLSAEKPFGTVVATKASCRTSHTPQQGQQHGLY